MADTHTIEIDAETADMLTRQASERGLTVAELVAELALTAAGDADIAELERRSRAIHEGKEKTIPHEEVVRWLETWGAPSFRPWSAK